MYPASTNYSIDGVLFGNYLCIGSKSKIKIFGTKEHYGRFQNQNHTAFENKKFVGSSEILLEDFSDFGRFVGSSGNSSDFGRFVGSSGNSSDFGRFVGSSGNSSDFGRF